jgi:arylsulfatase A-like enzyme
MKNSVRILSVIAAVALVAMSPAAAAQPATQPAAARPNIVLVLADQWRAQALGYAGDPNVKTPHLDRLQREGICFTNAVSSVPVCCPARASLMTGQRALTHGVFLNDVPLSPDAVTLPKVLRAAGYDTAAIGKWHLDGHGRSNFVPRQRRQGFEYWKVLECTHNYNRSFYYADGPEKLLWDGYDAIAQTRDAQAYLRAHARSGRPLFLFLAWGPPHDPYQTAPQKYRDLYRTEDLVLRANVPEHLRPQARQMLAGYYAHCTALDECLGDIRYTLKETGMEQNTIFLFTSDHGDLLGSQGGRNKQQPYDEAVCVPLLVRWPAGLGEQPQRLDAPITLEDLMPTLLSLCGLPIPKSVEGRDYSGYLRGGKDPSDGAALVSCPAPFGQWNRQIGREYRGIRTRRYSYVCDLKGPWLLLDNQSDPCQRENLVGRPEQVQLQGELDAVLRRKLRETHNDFLPADAYVQKWGYRVDASGTVRYTE